MENNNCDKKLTPLKKKQIAIKSINNYLSQLKMHYELTDTELFEILKIINLQYKKFSYHFKWWNIFK